MVGRQQEPDQYGSREELRRRSPGSRNGGGSGSSLSTDGMHRPGQPIGFLAARGTPYEKKYLTKKLGFCCKVIAPIVAIPALVIALVPVVWALALHTLNAAQLHVDQANLTSITNTSFPLSLDARVRRGRLQLVLAVSVLTNSLDPVNRLPRPVSSPPRSTSASQCRCSGGPHRMRQIRRVSRCSWAQ